MPVQYTSLDMIRKLADHCTHPEAPWVKACCIYEMLEAMRYMILNNPEKSGQALLDAIGWAHRDRDQTD